MTQTPTTELLSVVSAMRDYIDALPSDVVASLPTMPGFDRDWADEVIKGANLEAQPVAVEAITEIMEQEWGEWCDDAGNFPDDFEWQGGNGILSYEPGRWSRRVANRIINLTAPPAPVVPDEITAPLGAIANGYQLSIAQAEGYRWGWNACRAAMLAVAPE